MIEILNNRSVIHIHGSDSKDFLQGLITNDINKNIFSYNYLLSNQARYLFDFFIYKKDQNSYFCDIDRSQANNFIKKLSMYKLRKNVDISDISNILAVVYSKSKLIDDVIFSDQDPRYNKLGYRSFIKKEYISSIKRCVDNLYVENKYRNAIPDGFSDLVEDRSIVVEYGANELNAIDYEKGCYIGQEVISRVKYQGVIRKKIFKLKFLNELKNIDSLEVKNVENEIGEKLGTICSYYKNFGIAILREEKYLNMKDKIGLVNGHEVMIEIPPWRS